ncbi:MAG TPA: hypothetical protein VLB82_00750 [Thermodesulfobacteriota bacterium]|nr:hypothetical protein [Thermodesulfobacteriota bacterium]
MSKVNELLDKVIEAHGGMDAWNRVDEINVTARTGGLLPLSKLKYSSLSKVNFTVYPKTMMTVFNDFPELGSKGVFDKGTVYIENGSGEIEEERENPREQFNRISKKLYWDYLDTIYFTGYAIWNYLCTPFMFKTYDFELSIGQSIEDEGEILDALKVIYPDNIHTHCKEQTLYFDSFGLLRRLDYTADVIGSWAHAAHYCFDYVKTDGISFPLSRKVYMRKTDGTHAEFPIVIWIKLSQINIK